MGVPPHDNGRPSRLPTGVRRLLDFRPFPVGESPEERKARARKWASSDLPRRRREGLSILAKLAPDEALEPLFSALSDPDVEVRRGAFIGLLGYGPPPASYGERIVQAFGGDAGAAQEWVKAGYGPATIGWFGLTDRLLPHLDGIAANGKGWRRRRVAAKYARELRRHPPGWPVLAETGEPAA